MKDPEYLAEEVELAAADELFAEAQARAREQAAYEQLKASGEYTAQLGELIVLHTLQIYCSTHFYECNELMTSLRLLRTPNAESKKLITLVF